MKATGLKVRQLQLASATVEVDKGSNTVVFKGKLAAPMLLSRLLMLVSELHAEAMQAQLSEVRVDLSTLDYAATDLWKAVVRWLRMMHDSRSSYRLILLIDEGSAWQEIGTSMLHAFNGKQLLVHHA